MAAPLTEAAIEQMRHLITSGDLVPGQRLPPEAELYQRLLAFWFENPSAVEEGRNSPYRWEPVAARSARRFAPW